MDFNDVPEMAAEVEISAGPERPPTEASTSSTYYAEALNENVHLLLALERDPSLQTSALHCIQAAKAKGTVKNYSSALKFFEKFCRENDLSYPDFSTDVVIQYVLHLDKNRASFATLAKIKPALVYLEQSLDKPTAFTASLDLIIKGAENRALARRRPVRKAPTVPATAIGAILTKTYVPYLHCSQLIEPATFRTIFRMIFIYHTLCRFDCFKKLQKKLHNNFYQ